jgi:7-keto-8-aminopelargonate synthetase-like enzyme
MTPLDRLVARRERDMARLARRLEKAGLVGQRVDAVRGRHVLVGGRWLINFASSDYLGLAGHPAVRRAAAEGARRWGISLSQPRFWATAGLTAALERELARLVGSEQALVFASTMQLAQDVLPALAGPRGSILIDERAYPISRRAAEMAALSGATVGLFCHNDPSDLARALGRRRGPGDQVIVCDGLYMAAAETAALDAFASLAERYDATIYLDDAQGLGLLGREPSAAMPYGWGGAGTPAYCSVRSGRLVYASTLAKALGAPLAFVAGPAGFIDYLRSAAFSHVHSSPPALPVVAAALAAVRLHAGQGDQLRRRLLHRVQLYQAATGQNEPASCLPLQSVYFDTPRQALAAGARLRREGIWPIVELWPEERPAGGAVRFLFTATHTAADVERLVEARKGVLGV